MPVSGFSQRDSNGRTIVHRNALWSGETDGQHDNRRTRSTRSGCHDSPGWHQPGSVQIPGLCGHQHGLNVSAFADINVSAFDAIAGQQGLTLSRRISRERNITLTFWADGRYPVLQCRWATQPQLATPARNGFERRVPLWHFAALPHTPTAVSRFLLFADWFWFSWGSGGRMPFGSLTAFVVSCGQISPGARHTQSGGETFHAGPSEDSDIRYARISPVA